MCSDNESFTYNFIYFLIFISWRLLNLVMYVYKWDCDNRNIVIFCETCNDKKNIIFHKRFVTDSIEYFVTTILLILIIIICYNCYNKSRKYFSWFNKFMEYSLFNNLFVVTLYLLLPQPHWYTYIPL